MSLPSLQVYETRPKAPTAAPGGKTENTDTTSGSGRFTQEFRWEETAVETAHLMSY